jgi:hypothetical protein
MKTIKLFFVAAFAAFAIASCNVDNADSPANTVTQADTTTTDPQGLTFEGGAMDPAAVDTMALDSATNHTTTEMPVR